jgi:hypothetical protein
MVSDRSCAHISKSDWRGMEVTKIAVSEDTNLFWTVEIDMKIQQNGTYNCGPFACMKVMAVQKS